MSTPAESFRTVSPVRFYAVDQQEEALSFAEEGGISVIPTPWGYSALGRRRLLVRWAMARGYRHENLQLPTITGVWHVDIAGAHAEQLRAELGLPGGRLQPDDLEDRRHLAKGPDAEHIEEPI